MGLIYFFKRTYNLSSALIFLKKEQINDTLSAVTNELFSVTTKFDHHYGG